jgi:hypothetical protein
MQKWLLLLPRARQNKNTNSGFSMKIRIWLTRAFIAPVVFFNLQCSLAFLLMPASYAPSFDLFEPTGIYIIQGLGLLFLMWNIPYLVALINPQKYIISLIEAAIMQAIGVIGETILFSTVPSGYLALRVSVFRFIVFDGCGLVLLFIALLISHVRKCPAKP